MPRKCIATDAALILAALLVATAAAAAPAAGSLARSSGLVLAQGADGHSRILAEGSTVAAGDALVTGRNTYAQVDFRDAGSVVISPESEVVVDGDLTLVRGMLKVAARPNARVTTPLGEVTGAGATFIVTYSTPDAAKVAVWAPVRLAALSPAASATVSDASPMQLAQLAPSPPPGPGLAPGLYVHVIDGIINLSNKGGSTSFAAGQFGFTASVVQAPVVVPANPGLKFTPPPQFSQTTGPATSTAPPKSNTVDCEVR